MPTVLFADVGREWRDLYVRAITSFGFEVETADSGPECIARLRESPPDLLILDSDLPGGDRVLDIMRRSPRSASIPVIVLAKADATRIREFNSEPPAVQIMTKPVPLYKLRKCMQNALARPTEATREWEADGIPSEVFIG
jgi:CheY-like chemotaxis protein